MFVLASRRRAMSTAITATVFALGSAGCGGDGPSEPRIGPPSSVVVTAGADQTAQVAAAVPTPPAVRVTDSNGTAISGQAVVFTVTAGGGTVTGATATTDASGVARVGSWTLGTAAGTNTLSVTAGSVSATITATGRAGPAAALTKQAGDGQTAAVGAALATRPAVQVRDAHGNAVSGQAVVFAVASGGGALTGGSATTDATGTATVGGWTLGPSVGPNTLTVTAGSAPAVTFSATATAGAAAQLAKQAGDNQTAVAGATVAVAPAVVVRDALNNPVANVSVSFAIASGGGAITGGSATTNALGVATLGSWTLGTATGPNTLTATAGSLPAVTFTATGLTGPAAILAKADGDTQTGVVSAPVATPPRVRVTDANANPVAGFSVTFTPAAASGSIVGGTVATDANGFASVGQWTLGPAPGTHSLQASASGLQAVTFTATAISACASTPVAYTIGSTLNSQLTNTDCKLANQWYTDFYGFTTTGALTSVRFTLTSTQFDAYLDLTTAAGAVISFNDNSAGNTTNSAIHMLLPAGAYIVRPSTTQADRVGTYALTSAVVPQDVAGCTGNVFAVAPITTPQVLQNTDCARAATGGTHFSDQIGIWMTAGRTYTISMSSLAFNTALMLMGPSGQVVAANNDFGGSTNSQIVYLAPTTGPYRIDAGSATPLSFGNYTLVIAVQ